MTEQEIIQNWRSGLSKDKLALMYKREYNQQIRVIRSSVRHRHDGKFITSYEALAHVEKVIYKNLKESETDDNRTKARKKNK